MFNRSIALFAFGLAAVLFSAAETEAQPGKGKGGAPGAGADVKNLENELSRLLEQVKETQAKLARVKEGSGKKGAGAKGKKGGFEGKGKGGFEGKKGSEGKGKGKGKGFEGKKKDASKKEMAKGPFGGKGGLGGKMDAETIKQKYEFYKKLHHANSKSKSTEGKGPGGWGRGGFGKGGFGPKGFEGKKKEPSPPKGRPGADDNRGSSRNSLESRVDRLIRELEDLRSELKRK